MATLTSARRDWGLLASLRVALHLGVILAVTLRSAHIGNTLHPFERALANEWIHLLFFVVSTRVVEGSPDAPAAVVVETLPHFILESAEEIAANVDDEFFGGGFAARASSLPVGLLFTVNETTRHLHGAVDNYFRLPRVALDAYDVADGGADVPWPRLTVWSSWDGESVPREYTLTGKNESEWPAPLRLATASTNATEVRDFFDKLDGLELEFIVGIPEKDNVSTTPAKDTFEWWIRFTYDLQSQSHLEVALNFGLQPKPSRAASTALGHSEEVPPIFLDSNTAFDWSLLGLLLIYQLVEFGLKWSRSRTSRMATSPGASKESRTQTDRLWRVVVAEARDFWFWFILMLNVATIICVHQAWYHAYRLYLRDALCLAFATCCALQWISLVRYLRVNTRFHILGLTLTRGLPRVAQFLVGVFPIFVGYVLFGTIMFGAKVPRFQSASTTATTLFSVANGDEIHDTFNAVAFTPWIGQIYVYTYMILFSYVVLMVCIGIIEDAFFSAVFPASWPSLHNVETLVTTSGSLSGVNEEFQSHVTDTTSNVLE